MPPVPEAEDVDRHRDSLHRYASGHRRTGKRASEEHADALRGDHFAEARFILETAREIHRFADHRVVEFRRTAEVSDSAEPARDSDAHFGAHRDAAASPTIVQCREHGW